MAGINYSEFANRFAGIKPSPVYLFVGPERFFIEEGVRLVKERFLEGGIKEFNYDSIYAADIKPSKVIEIAETLPVMTSYRVIVVKGIDGWTTKEKEGLLSYINNPSKTTCLILTATKLDRREKFTAAVEKNATFVLCQPLYKQQLIGWIKQEVRRSGKGIDDEAVYMLADMTGNDMLSLRSDIEKLTMYCKDKKSMSINDVAAASSSMRSVSVFEVVNAMVERRYKDGVYFLKRALDEGEPPVRIFYFIVKELRAMLKARTLIDAGESPERAAIRVGVPPFKVKEFSQRLQKFPTRDLITLFDKLIDADSSLKGGAVRPGIVLENLLLSASGTVRPGGKP
ncbi:MAG: DNA polymerase III subunit delta [Nitrospirae bacterium]|nr:DNA polymerase III subunit delta [Nitrospirota bacterium]